VTTTTEQPRRRVLPGPGLVWLALFTLAVVLASTRPVTPDLRWHPNARTSFPEPEGIFYSWTIPALGIVLSFASILTRPIGRSIRRRLLRTWMVTVPGVIVVSAFLEGPTPSFTQTDVGSCGVLMMFLAHGVVMVISTIAVARILRRRTGSDDVTPPRAVKRFAAVGSTVVLLIGVGFFWMAQDNDPLEALHGEARAKAFLAELPKYDRFSARSTGRLVDGRWEGRNGSSIRIDGDQFDFQVPVPWPADAITARATPEKIVALLNSPAARQQRLGIAPEPPWRAEWHPAAGMGDATIVFGFRTPADAWPFLTFFVAAGELDSIAGDQWADNRAAVKTLLDEGYAPPAAAPPPESRDAMQVRLMWLAIQTERLAAACEADQVKISDGRTAPEAFREVSARAWALRTAVRANGPIPNADLERLGNDAWHLAGENRWDRPDGCRVMRDSTESIRLNSLGYEIKTTAANTK
jgi:hypothetical protein